MSGISRDEWLRALDEIRPTATNDPNAVSATEFAALAGMGIKQARQRLGQLVEAGKAERVIKWMRRTDGQHILVTAYRLTASARPHSKKRTPVRRSAS